MNWNLFLHVNLVQNLLSLTFCLVYVRENTLDNLVAMKSKKCFFFFLFLKSCFFGVLLGRFIGMHLKIQHKEAVTVQTQGASYI